jgi:hypothetical protein
VEQYHFGVLAFYIFLFDGELFCKTGMECREKVDPERDITVVNKKPVFSCQSQISVAIQGSFLSK